MKFIGSKKAKRICTIACLYFLEFLPIDKILEFFENFMLIVVVNIFDSFEKKEVQGQNKLFHKELYSFRKNNINKKGLFQDLNLHSFFKEQIKVN